ncbi:hypothetical protein EJB05_31959 [Eragrostis curvula]|uniref:Uncharacterized protein n=1 Tax=Eragrostis curvula TaxID=38414 RepID=A0A5J9UEW7_9POAL|nr:hypothetical protein EJB05_31959 [Eragrostis curvula]
MDRLTAGLAAASLSDPADQGAAAAARGAGAGPSSDYLRHVMRAVEGADATIRSQLEENNRLKEELMQKTLQLQRMREGATSQSAFAGAGQDSNYVSNKMDGSKLLDNGSLTNNQSTSTHHQNGGFVSGEPVVQENMKQKYLDSAQTNGAFKRSSREHIAFENGGPSQFSTPSSRSLSPTRDKNVLAYRHRKDGDYDSRLLPVSDVNSHVSWKQELTVKVKENEEEIAQLKKHLADYSMKEAKILDDKYMLEKRIAYMRMAFDQQQQDLIDAASKALSYRQDIIEENIRLSYALQAAQQERSTFISSLLPLLSEYDSLQPSVLDAQSIVSNLKVLFKHLQEQLFLTENFEVSKSSLDIVPQTAYPHVQSPMSSPVQARREWGVLGNKNHQVIPSEVPTRSAEHDDMGGTSISSRNQFRMDVPAQVSQRDSHAVQFDLETQSHNQPFKGLSRNDVLDGSEGAEAQNAQESSVWWGPGDSTNLASGLEDANPSYPYLPTVLEEPGSSFSEAAEDDPLPGIDGLQITGEPFPGRELQASGYPTNGTTTCNFEWVRHLEDGSVNFIEGARQPSYVVTADDVDTLLAIEVQPLDDRKRKGDFIKVYANEQRKITCDPETKELIKRTLEIGHVTYEVQVQMPVRFLDMWEPAVLAIKREGYSIKCNGQRGVLITEKFQQATLINIPYGRLTEFSITSADGVDYNLMPAENTFTFNTEPECPILRYLNTLPDNPFMLYMAVLLWLRDTIVLVLRLFKNMAVERRRGRKKGLFFK